MQVFEPPPLPANTSAEPVPAQQPKLDRFRHNFNRERPHESIAMRRPAQVYRAFHPVLPEPDRAV